MGGAEERSLRETPTWALAVVCAIFVILSILIEHAIHSLGKWFQKKRKKAMGEALEKLKSELMLLGFISLLLTVGTRFISKICLPSHYGYSMLPCKYEDDDSENGDDHRRKLLYLADNIVPRRSLSAATLADYCETKGKVALISQSGVHQLHIFIFVLAVFHVLYSVMTMALGKAKMKKWKSWESETSTAEYQSTTDPERFRFTHQTSFVMRHSGLSTTPVMRWMVAFFRQFFASVTKVDYLTMRHGFINAHLSSNGNFNFHRYIKRSMEDDFKVVVGISFPLWMFAIIFLLLNVYRWHTLSYLAFAPLILQLIIMEMAQEIQDRTTIVRGAPVVEPTNKLFWFNRPHWILLLIHFTMFQNAFQMAYFLWIWYEFGLRSCFHENLVAILTRVFLGVALQILCSYITFPLYALVTQMGSHMKKAIFEEQTAKAIKMWQKAAKERTKLREAGVLGVDGSSTHSRSVMSDESTTSNSNRLGHADTESFNCSQRSQQSDKSEVLSDCEGSVHQNQHESRSQEHEHNNIEDSCSVDFSFVNL